MPLIYEPRGAAREYAPLAANLYMGCTHGCVYCYVPDVLRADKSEFHAEARPKGGGDGSHILAQLEREAARLAEKGVKGPVLLSFTTDPYQPAEMEFRLTTKALAILAGHGVQAMILTKAWIIRYWDYELWRKAGHVLGVTLTGTNYDPSAYEPNAGGNHLRINHLFGAKGVGIKTWASIEPVIYPADSLAAIREAAPYTGHFAVGKLNHLDPPEPIDWRKFKDDAVNLLEALGYRRVEMEEGWQKPKGTYYLKQDLLEAAGLPRPQDIVV